MDPVIGVVLCILIVVAVVFGLKALNAKNSKVPVFEGVAPGVIPANPDAHPTHFVSSKNLLPNPPPPRFEPPERILSWMTGALGPKGVGGRDFGALVVDLAVAGYIRIDKDPNADQSRRSSNTDWNLTRTNKDASHLVGAPRELMLMAFPQGNPGDATEMDALSRRARAGVGQIVRDCMNKDADMAIGAGNRFERHPIRTALQAQTDQFHQYLKTAEADQIRVEEAASIFSRYLPWAIALGEAEHWAKVFKDVARNAGIGDGSVGATDAVILSTWGTDLAWFGGVDFGGFGDGGFDGGFFDGGFDGLGDSIGGLTDGIGDFGSSMDSFGGDIGGGSGGSDGGSSGGGWSSCSSGASCGSSSSCGGSSCGGGGGCGGGS